MPSNVKLLAGASGGEPTDANFKNVTLLLHGDGSNGAQNNTFIDSSTNNFTITRNGNTTQGSFSPYGSNWSNYFDGSGDYLTMPSNAAFAFGTGDYTIEGWFYPTAGGINQRLTWFSDDRHNIDIDTSNQIFLYDGSIRTFGTVNINSWNHFAVSRSGGTVSCYLNGVRGYNASETTNSTTRSMNIGANNVANNPFNGYISNLRVVKGTAVYSGSTITVPTAPLTAITNTSLLTCAYNRFRDGSTNNFTITRNGDVKVTNFAPFAPSSAYSTTTNGGSAYFDGSGDYLNVASNTAFNVSSGDWTVQGWYYTGTYDANNRVICSLGSAGDNLLIATIGSNGYLYYLLNDAVVISTTSAAPANSWAFFALVKSGSTTTLYLNGTSIGTTTSVPTSSNKQFVIGRAYDASSPYSGYVSDLRVLKGTANTTVPTAPLTNITNTSILCNFTNAAIFDNSMKNDLETVGNAQISTSVKKFGTGSMSFDGTGDNLICNTSTPDHFAFGSGDFTIELWAYMNSVSGIQVFYDGRPASVQTFAPTIYINGTQVRYFNNGADRITGGTVATGTWYHIALCRSGTSTKLFLDGTQIGSTYTDSSVYTNTAGRPGIGFDANASLYYLNGYIDELRVTKGVARYTANFTAPTAPFPNK